MRILGIGEYNSLGDLYRRLIAEGHEVRVFVEHPDAQQFMAGMVTRIADWRLELDWIRQAGDDGVIVFETACHGQLQDQLRADGYNVIGGCAWGDRLESDREFGQQILRQAGLSTAATHSFNDVDQAIAFVRDRPARYVFKLCGSHAASTRNYVGQLDDGADVIGMLRMESTRATVATADATQAQFVLMDHVSGVEVGVGAYFDGQSFLQPACLDWEHKHFFPQDLGELTGEMGTVVTYRGAGLLFEKTLGRLEETLRRYGYCGYINLNTIVNRDGIWPLEFTCRFGYPGYSICSALHRESWAVIFKRIVRQTSGPIATRAGYAVGVVVTIPPFPYAAAADSNVPVFFRGTITDEERQHLHLGDIAMIGDQMVVTGRYGDAMVVTGVGDDVAAARGEAYGLVKKIVIPNQRYRHDIGEKLLREDMAAMVALGLYDAAAASC